MTPAQRRSAAVAARKSLDKERDPAVRGALVHALARFGGATGWVPVLLTYFEGRADDPARAAARQAVLWGGGDYLEVVQRLLEEDEDPTFKADLILLLGDRRRPDAVVLLLEALDAKHRRVASAAAEALEAITGQSLGFDRARWTTWWETQGQAALVQPEPPTNGESVTVADEPVIIEEPEPHVTRSLLPDFYGLKLTGKDIVFVLDISGSVGAGGVAAAKRKLVDAVESLGSDVYIAALFFSEEVHMWKPAMVRATPRNKAELSHFLRGIQPGRKTDVFTPLNAAIQIVRRRVEARQASGQPIREAITLVVVSDGVETHSVTPPHIVADKLDRLDPRYTVVHAVALGSKGSRLMAELARRGGGHYVQAR
jgi:hypothetical protein